MNNTELDLLEGHYIYFTRRDGEYHVRYLLYVDAVGPGPLKSERVLTSGHVIRFTVPDDGRVKCFTYMDLDRVTVGQETDIHVTDRDGYLGMFREFVRCEGMYPGQLPDHLR